MGTYDRLHHTMTCPRCHQVAVMEIEARWPCGDQRDLHIGDRVTGWAPRCIPKNGGRPADGTANWDGYAECPNCQKDFFAWVHVVNDVITSVSVDTTREGYIKDESP